MGLMPTCHVQNLIQEVSRFARCLELQQPMPPQAATQNLRHTCQKCPGPAAVPGLCPGHTYSNVANTITQAKIWALSPLSLMSSGDNLILVAWLNTLCHKHYKQTTVCRMDVPASDSAPKIHRILHQPPVLYSSDRNLIQAGS